jgi:hypothetical protein
MCRQLAAKGIIRYFYSVPGGGAEIASTGNRNYGNGKYKSAHFEMMENASTENRSIIRYGGKRKYGNGKY